jgi:hypothetical protein
MHAARPTLDNYCFLGVDRFFAKQRAMRVKAYDT